MKNKTIIRQHFAPLLTVCRTILWHNANFVNTFFFGGCIFLVCFEEAVQGIVFLLKFFFFPFKNSISQQSFCCRIHRKGYAVFLLGWNWPLDFGCKELEMLG